jgi:hypothetical protein
MEFAVEARREARALADADRRGDDMEFVEAISAVADDECVPTHSGEVN